MVSYRALALGAGVWASLLTVQAYAADVGGKKPAVSAVNGKIELDGGWGRLDGFPSTGVFDGAASLSVPLSDFIGLQADVAAKSEFNQTIGGGTLHLFTRDPDSYLFGGIGGATFATNANAWYVGPEAEFYLNNVSLEATGGYLRVNPNFAASTDTGFGIVDLAFYATDNFRLSVGAADVNGFKSLHGGFEYQLSDVGMPLSLTGDVRGGDNNYLAGTLGLKIYFGGTDKSLIRRHREDDPRNRSLDIFNASGGTLNPVPPSASTPGPAPECTPYPECTYVSPPQNAG